MRRPVWLVPVDPTDSLGLLEYYLDYIANPLPLAFHTSTLSYL